MASIRSMGSGGSARVSGTDGEAVEVIRRFNRFYTRQLGLLNDGYQGTRFTLTEVRVLYEVANRDGCTATEIAQELGIDLGYLSRVLAKFERLHFLIRKRSPIDARQYTLRLSKAGQAAFAPLDRSARDQVSAMTVTMTAEQKRQLLSSMQGIQRLLESQMTPAEEAAPYTLRPFRIGDIGWITHRQGILYAQEYGWDGTYEALVAEILAAFVNNFDAAKEYGWVAERDGRVVGSVFLVRASDRVAKLRLLYVEPSTRGSGLGRKLVEECVNFARAKGYRMLTLWTNDILVSARRIYESVGFKLTKEEPHQSFGKNLVGQTWDLDLDGKGQSGPSTS